MSATAFKPSWTATMSLSRLMLTLAGVLALAGCAGTPPPPTVVTSPVVCSVDPTLRQATPRPPLPPGPPTTVADVTAFSIKQEAAISMADGRRASAVQALDDCNAANASLSAQLRKIKP